MNSAGRLRREVEVVRAGHFVLLRYGFWETRLPIDWVRATQGFDAFLERQVSIDELRGAPGLAGVFELLDAQGCLSRDPPGAELTLSNVRENFIAQSTPAYGRYYGHHAWTKIRQGNRFALAAWLAHNLQLSRSVGQTAARAALCGDDMAVRAAFLRNCIEEYDHFERYFKVAISLQGASGTDFSRAVPSPATLSFTLQMLYMAETDSLAHVLVAWFQERTACFASDAAKFYRDVEQNMGLPGFFRPWLEHVAYDSRKAHAEAFGTLLNRDVPVERSGLERSLRNASFAVHHLICALDEIGCQPPGGRGAPLRLPPERGLIDPSATRLLDAWPETGHRLQFAGQDLGHLFAMFCNAGLLIPNHTSIDPADLSWLTQMVGQACLRAISHSERDEDLLTFGALVDALAPAEAPREDLPHAPTCLAIAALVNELARDPWRLALVLRVLLELEPLENAERLISILDGRLDMAAIRDPDDALLLMIQITELVFGWRCETITPPLDVFWWP